MYRVRDNDVSNSFVGKKIRIKTSTITAKEMFKPCNDSTGGSSETVKMRTRSFLGILLLLGSQYRDLQPNKRVCLFFLS